MLVACSSQAIIRFTVPGYRQLSNEAILQAILEAGGLPGALNFFTFLPSGVIIARIPRTCVYVCVCRAAEYQVQTPFRAPWVS